MATIFKIPDKEDLVDRQFFQVPVADGLLAGYQFDAETCTLYAKESQVIVPGQHGITHIGEDPVPNATVDSPGLMSQDDKAKLDSLLQTRVGVLGFQGSGFADDGGFLVGDIILAAGTEFISLERVGNVVRFTVDSPIPLDCACEVCAQIFWIQDESEPSAIRPPSCNGKMPGVNAYGELKIYTFPEDAVLDPNNPLATLNEKGQYPALIFKRYDQAITAFENEFEMVLKRNSNLTTQVGWACTPGFNGKAECVWFAGVDKNGAQNKFELWPEQEPGLLGAILFNGHRITRQAGVIVDYPSDILATNNYTVKKWDVQSAVTIGESFGAKNIWQYDNPENLPTATSNPQSLVLDQTRDLLPIGTLVDLWEYEINRTSEGRLTRAFFSKRPDIRTTSMWALSGAQRFGDLFTAREEVNDPQEDTAISASELNVSDVRLFEKVAWGLNQFEDRLILSDDGGEVEATDGSVAREPSGEPINNDVVADIDPTIPGLRVIKQAKSLIGDINGDGVVDDEDLQLFLCAYGKTVYDEGYNPNADFNDDGVVDIRDLAILGQQFDLNVDKVPDTPVFLWHRTNHKNILLRAKLGQPDDDSAVEFPPYDILLSAPVDSFDDTYLKVIKRGVFTTGPFAGAPYIVAKGMRWEDMPAEGVLRILTGAFRNTIWRYYFKAAFANWDDDGITLIGRDEVFPFDEDFPIGEGQTACTAVVTGDSEAESTESTDATGTDECPTETTGSEPEPGSSELDAAEVPENTTVVELLRQDYTAPVIRLQFSMNRTTGSESVQLQFRVGILDMSVPYECNEDDPEDDLVRGLSPGYTVSKVMVQNGFIDDGIGEDVTSDPEGFRVYQGGELDVPVNGEVEKWNDIEVMFRDNEVWIWWNDLLISPDTVASANLPTPVTVNTPYFPINTQVDVGKMAFRMFPGAILRSAEIYDQLIRFNEWTNGQIELTN
jgi:hypothetical protein